MIPRIASPAATIFDADPVTTPDASPWTVKVLALSRTLDTPVVTEVHVDAEADARQLALFLVQHMGALSASVCFFGTPSKTISKANLLDVIDAETKGGV